MFEGRVDLKGADRLGAFGESDLEPMQRFAQNVLCSVNRGEVERRDIATASRHKEAVQIYLRFLVLSRMSKSSRNVGRATNRFSAA
jgi:hypothetical protein